MERFTHEFDRTVQDLIIDVTVYGNYQAREVKALIDTGCTNTSISIRLAKDMQLQPINTKPMRNASNQVLSCPVYRVSMAIGDNVHLPAGEITEYPLETDKFDVLIGMDVLCLCDFAVMNSDGKSKLTIIYNN